MIRPKELHPAASSGLYLFALVLAFWPLADLALNTFPPRSGDVQWRYGFLGLLSSYLHTPMLGVVLASGTAWACSHPRTLKLLSFLSLAGAVLLLAAMGLFALDLLQVRALRGPDVLPAVTVGGIIAEAKMLSTALVLVLLGIGGLKTAGQLEHAASRGSSPGVVARPTSAST